MEKTEEKKTCALCNKRAVVYYKFSKPLCEKHFKQQIESRVKKTFREFKIIEKKKLKKISEIKILINNEEADFLINKIIAPILKKSRIKYKKIKNENFKKTNLKKDLIIRTDFADEISDEMLKNMIFGKDPCKNLNNSILKNILRTEAFLYKALNKSTGFFSNEKIKEIDLKMNSQIDEDNKRKIDKYLILVEEKHPGTKFSMVRSFEKICLGKR